jgi:hypothetical protein
VRLSLRGQAEAVAESLGDRVPSTTGSTSIQPPPVACTCSLAEEHDDIGRRAHRVGKLVLTRSGRDILPLIAC